MPVSLRVNGRPYTVDIDPQTPLLYVLSDDLALRGPKFGCGLGQCGACTVIARGRAEILPFDVARGRRKLSRYLGEDEARWDRRFRHHLHDDPAGKGTVWLRLRPDSLVASDLSYSVWPSGDDG